MERWMTKVEGPSTTHIRYRINILMLSTCGLELPLCWRAHFYTWHVQLHRTHKHAISMHRSRLMELNGIQLCVIGTVECNDSVVGGRRLQLCPGCFIAVVKGFSQSTGQVMALHKGVLGKAATHIIKHYILHILFIFFFYAPPKIRMCQLSRFVSSTAWLIKRSVFMHFQLTHVNSIICFCRPWSGPGHPDWKNNNVFINFYHSKLLPR